MKKLFSMDNPFMQALDIAADLLVLNLLALACCLPVVTAGAAYTALNDVILRILRREEGHIVRDYFRAFKRDLKQGVPMGLLFLLAAGLLYVDYLSAQAYVPPLRIGVAAIALIVLAIALYAFALLARFENTVRGTLKNAAVLAVAYFPRTLGALVFVLAFWLLALRFLRFSIPVLLMFGLSLPCYLCLMLFKDVLDKMEQ